MREQLTEAELAQVDDAMIHRYVRAAWGAHGPDLKHVRKQPAAPSWLPPLAPALVRRPLGQRS